MTDTLAGFDTDQPQTFYVDDGSGVPKQHTGRVVAVRLDEAVRPWAVCLRSGEAVETLRREVWISYARVIRWHAAVISDGPPVWVKDKSR